jgi:hypothetical protein
MLSPLRTTAIATIFLALAPCAGAWTWPASGQVLEPFRYGGDPYAAGQHRGIDVGGATREAIVAPRGGVVSFAGSVPTNGLTVTIETPDGYSVTVVHLGSITVTRGAQVAEGAPLGAIGPSGTPERAVPYVLHGRSDDLRPERLPRPARLPASACGGARERALVVAGEAARAEGENGDGAAPGSCSRQRTCDRARPRLGPAACDQRDCCGRDAAGRAARAGRGRARRARSGSVRSRFRCDPHRSPGAARRPSRCRASAARAFPADRVDPIAAGTCSAARPARRRAGRLPVPDGAPGTPAVAAAGVECSRRPQGGSGRGRSRPAPPVGADRARRPANRRRGSGPRRSAGLRPPERGGGGGDRRRLSYSRAARARGPRSRGFGRCDPAAPRGSAVVGPAGGPWGATYHLWRCAST